MTQKIVLLYSLFFLFSINLSAQLVYSLEVTAPDDQPNVAKFTTTSSGAADGIAVWGDATSFNSIKGIGGYFIGGSKGVSAATELQSPNGSSVYAVHAVNQTSGSGTRFGVYSFMNLESTATGNHYGLYASVNPTDGTDYGVYTVAGGEDDWAGYFLGAGYFEAKPWMVGLAKKQPLEINADIPPSDEVGLDGNKGLLIYYKDNSDWGGSLVARETMEGGFNVGRGQGSKWAPIHALDFVVQTNDPFTPSEDDSKKNIKRKDLDDYMQSIRDIKAVNVHRTGKNYLKPSAKRLNIDMTSFPENLQIEEHTTTEGIGETNIVVSLVDWTSLLTLGVQENDQKVQELTAENTELKEKLTALEQEMAAIHQLLVNNNSLNIPTDDIAQTAILANDYLVQNAPNPFHANTTIRYQLPAETQTAQLKISDQQGTIIKVITLNNNSQGQVELQKGTLTAGNYQYSLVADGKVLATKQMILTK